MCLKGEDFLLFSVIYDCNWISLRFELFVRQNKTFTLGNETIDLPLLSDIL